MVKKRIISILLAAVIAAAAVGCSDSTDSTDSTPKKDISSSSNVSKDSQAESDVLDSVTSDDSSYSTTSKADKETSISEEAQKNPADRINVKKEVNETVKELFGYLSKDDTESIKNMFCTIVSESNDFDEELSNAVEFFEGEVTSYDLTAIGSEEKAEYGKTMQLHVSPYIEDVETSAGKSYKIRYYEYIVNSDNAQYVGISEIDIECDNGFFKLGDLYLADPD